MRNDRPLPFRTCPSVNPPVPRPPSADDDPRVLVTLSRLGPWPAAREAWLSELDRRIAALEAG